jgi:hypothetical protein
LRNCQYVIYAGEPLKTSQLPSRRQREKYQTSMHLPKTY